MPDALTMKRSRDLAGLGMVPAAGTMALMTVLASYLSYRVRFLRPVLDGEPIVLLQDGKSIDRNPHRERIARRRESVTWCVLEAGSSQRV